ncbi:MAG: phage portal protein [Pseudomonadota bacterium]
MLTFLRGVFAGAGDAAPRSRDPLDDFWFGEATRAAAAGETVTTDTAMTVPAVLACVELLAESIGTLPFGIVERRPGGERRVTENHPLAAVFSDPNDEQSGCEFLEQMVWDLATDGNAFVELFAGARGPVDRMVRRAPGDVAVERDASGRKRYRVRGPEGGERVVDRDDMWHTMRTPTDGLRGISPIWHGREVISAAIALQKFAGRYFANDSTPPFVVTNPGHFKDAEQKGTFLRALREWAGGRNRHTPAVLEFGMDIKRVGVTNNEAQFLETKQALNTEIARIWRIPPHKIGVLDKATFSNIEEQGMDFVTATLMPWLCLIESSIRKHLIQRPERYAFEFDVSGLLRGDVAKRFGAYAIGRQWGWLSINDIRAMESMNPIQGGGEYLQPLNMQPVGASEREPEPEPAAPSPEQAQAIAFLRRSTTGRPPLHLVTELPHAA